MLTSVIKALYNNGHEVSLLSDNGPLGFPSKKIFNGWKYLKDIFEFNPEGKVNGNDVVIWAREKNFDLCVQSYPADNLFDWLLPLIDIPIRKAPIITGYWEKHEVDYNMEMVKDLVRRKTRSFV
jgi:hypothetical protein